MATIRQFLEKLTGELTKGSGLGLSPIPLNVRLTPKQIMNKTFSIEYRTTNTNKYRDRTHIRMVQEISINYVVMIEPHKQYDSLLIAADREDTINQLMMDQVKFPEYYVRYKSTNRQVSTGGEYYFNTVIYDIEHDWSID